MYLKKCAKINLLHVIYTLRIMMTAAMRACVLTAYTPRHHSLEEDELELELEDEDSFFLFF